MTILEEEARRRKALEIQAQLAKSYTRGSGSGSEHVTGAPGPLNSAAKGVRAGAEAPAKGQKIASSSAAARAPEAAASAGVRAPEKTKPNRQENEFMLNLMILRNTLRTNAPSCKDRARRAGKWIWRDIRLMLTLVNRIQEKLIRTMPEGRDDYYSAYAKFGHYELKIDVPVRTSRHLLITDRHLATICEAAMKSECVFCLREGNEIGRCALREALLESAAPTAVEEGGSPFRKCEYREAAGQLIHGDDVTI